MRVTFDATMLTRAAQDVMFYMRFADARKTCAVYVRDDAVFRLMPRLYDVVFLIADSARCH